MIYLIGGVFKSGKSFVARKILKEKGIPVFETDFLLYSLGSMDGNNALFSYFEKDSTVSPLIKPYIEKIIYFIDRNNDNYVIEGTHITVSLYKELKEKYKDNVKAVFLGYDTEEKNHKYESIIKNKSNDENKWYTFLRKEEFLEMIDERIGDSKRLKTECLKEGFRYYDVKSIKEESQKIIDDLFGM